MLGYLTLMDRLNGILQQPDDFSHLVTQPASLALRDLHS